MTCCYVAAAVAGSGVFANTANCSPRCTSLYAMVKLLFWHSTKTYSLCQDTKDIQSTKYKICPNQPQNCPTEAQINKFRVNILHYIKTYCIFSWLLVKDQVKNKTVISIQGFLGTEMFLIKINPLRNAQFYLKNINVLDIIRSSSSVHKSPASSKLLWAGFWFPVLCHS